VLGRARQAALASDGALQDNGELQESQAEQRGGQERAA